MLIASGSLLGGVKTDDPFLHNQSNCFCVHGSAASMAGKQRFPARDTIARLGAEVRQTDDFI